MNQCKHASFIHPSLSLALTHGFLFFLHLCMGLHQPDGGAGVANIACLTSPSPCLLPLLECLSICALLGSSGGHWTARQIEALKLWQLQGFSDPPLWWLPFQGSDFLLLVVSACISQSLHKSTSPFPFHGQCHVASSRWQVDGAAC